MRHLGERVTALVDDQLDHEARDRALAHLARCHVCRADVERERKAKAALRGLPEVDPSPDLVRHLLELATPGGFAPPPRPPFPGGGISEGGRLPSAPAGDRSERSRLRRAAGARLALAGTFSAGLVALLLASLGEPEPTTPAPATVVPPVHQYTVEHARSSGLLLFSDLTPMVEAPVPDQVDGP